MHCNIKLEIAEDLIKALVKNLGTHEFFIAEGNAFCHGDIMVEINESFNDKQLEKIHDYLDGIKKIVKDIQ